LYNALHVYNDVGGCLVKKSALITGITGQDGYYLTKFLLEKNYIVHGVRQALAHDDRVHLKDFFDDITFHYGDMSDQDSLNRSVIAAQPDEIYNLAAQSHVGVSFSIPEYTKNVNGAGAERLLRAAHEYAPACRLYQAGTSELFGNAPAPQNENSPFAPESPYAEGKLTAHRAVEAYRSDKGLFAVNGILFNHESPKRGADFVTQKIVKAAVAIKAGQQDVLTLGNLDAQRDWGHAADYVEGMWLMLQQDTPRDFVLASGQTCCVRDFVTDVFAALLMPVRWQGSGIDEVAIFLENDQPAVRISSALYRPHEVHVLQGDPSLAKLHLGWSAKTSRNSLINEMILAAQG
jgi:GDPmannose 4,6-dehydratase